MFDADALHAMIDQAAAGQAAEPTPPAEPENPVAEPAPATEPAEPAGEPEVGVAGQADKDAAAFAQMRAENKAMGDLLRKVADSAGITYNSPSEMMEALNGDALTKIAEKKGIPVEFLQRMETLEANSKAWEQQQMQQRLQAGFAALQGKYGLDQAALMGFAKQLDDSGMDLRNIDIEKEYVASHMEDIISARVNAAVQAALSRDAQAGAQGVVPTAQGALGASAPDVKIKSAADLHSFLDSLSK